MKFMMMMNAPRGKTVDWNVVNWAPQDYTAHIAFMKDFSQPLQRAGEWVDGQGLASPGQARIVRAGKNGARPKRRPRRGRAASR